MEAHQQHISYCVFGCGNGYENLQENDCISYLRQQYCTQVEELVEICTDHHDHCRDVVAAGKEKKHC